MNSQPGQFNPQGNSDWLQKLLQALMGGQGGQPGGQISNRFPGPYAPPNPPPYVGTGQTPQPTGGIPPYSGPWNPPIDRTMPDQGTVQQPGSGPWSPSPMPGMSQGGPTTSPWGHGFPRMPRQGY